MINLKTRKGYKGYTPKLKHLVSKVQLCKNQTQGLQGLHIDLGTLNRVSCAFCAVLTYLQPPLQGLQHTPRDMRARAQAGEGSYRRMPCTPCAPCITKMGAI